MKPLHWHPLARRDADEAAGWYAHEGGLALELAFPAALQATVGLIPAHPGFGSPRYATVLNLAGLRFWPLKGFPHLVSYTSSATPTSTYGACCTVHATSLRG